MGVVHNRIRIDELEKGGGGTIEERLSHLEDEYTTLASYSDDEQLVGEWYDGSHLYRKVIKAENFNAQGKSETPLEANSVKMCYGSFINSYNNTQIALPCGEGGQYGSAWEFHNNTLDLYVTGWSVSTAEVVVYYTKNEE